MYHDVAPKHNMMCLERNGDSFNSPTVAMDAVMSSESRSVVSVVQVSDRAKRYVATDRCLYISQAKQLPKGYQHARDVEWHISKALRQAEATGRILELAQPILRQTMHHLQSDPCAFIVKSSALRGVVPGCVFNLSKPIIR